MGGRTILLFRKEAPTPSAYPAGRDTGKTTAAVGPLDQGAFLFPALVWKELPVHTEVTSICGRGEPMKLTDVLLRRKSGAVNQEESPGGWSEEVQAVPVHLITAGKYQPRQEFDDESLVELAESIRLHGLLQPIMLRRAAVGYELIVGERRLRACKLLGWEVIPAIVRDVDDREAAELALIENLQREDLHVLEVAEGYQRLLSEFNLTQEELAQRLGISQASVANKLRLLKLPEEIRAIISREMLSERHGRPCCGCARPNNSSRFWGESLRKD